VCLCIGYLLSCLEEERSLSPVFCDKLCQTDTIECSSCNSWVHRQCVGLTNDQYDEFAAGGVIYLCQQCIGRKPDGSYDWCAAEQVFSFSIALCSWLTHRNCVLLLQACNRYTRVILSTLCLEQTDSLHAMTCCHMTRDCNRYSPY